MKPQVEFAPVYIKANQGEAVILHDAFPQFMHLGSAIRVLVINELSLMALQ